MATANDRYAIEQDFKQLKPDKQLGILWLTRQIVDFQTKYKFSLLSVDNPKEWHNLLSNSEITSIVRSNQMISLLSETCSTYKMYKLIKRLLTQRTLLSESCRTFQLDDKDDQKKLIKFLNRVILINKIKQRLSNKTPDQIEQYNLLSQLEEINPKIQSQLGLDQLDSASDIIDFAGEYGNYQLIHFETLYQEISNEECLLVFDLFDLFI